MNTDFLNFLFEAPKYALGQPLSTRKSGAKVSSFQYYIQGNSDFLKEPFYIHDKTELLDVNGNVLASLKRTDEIYFLDITQTYKIHKGNGTFFKVRYGKLEGYVNWTKVQKPSKATYSGVRPQEEQEHAFVKEIKDALEIYDSIKLFSKKNKVIDNVTDVYKLQGLSKVGKEPYQDLIIKQKNKEVGISMKMDSQPSMMGGGLTGLLTIKGMKEYLNEVLKEQKERMIEYYKEKGIVADVYIKIKDKKILEQMFQGTKEMGGPVEYIIKGAKNPKQRVNNNELHFENLDFYDIKDFRDMFGDNIYLRIRKRKVDAEIVFEEQYANGVLILTKSSEGRERIVTTEGQPKSGNSIIIE